MKRTFYLFNPGRLSRKNNTLCYEGYAKDGPKPPKKYLPIEQVDALYVFGSLDSNSALFNYLGQQGVSMHFFDYYEHYRGSFEPKEKLLAGRVVLAQCKAHSHKQRRLYIAQRLLEGGSYNMRFNLAYYNRRGLDLENALIGMEALRERMEAVQSVPELMGVEGNMRQLYYEAFPKIVAGWTWGGRQKQPPSNAFNALVSFSNMLCYAQVLDAIWHTQLNPTVSFLHEPGERRYSMALDIAEVFKPVLVDRMLFKLTNRGQLNEKRHFEYRQGGCWLNNSGKKILLQEWEQRLAETIKHESLGRKVSYKRLLRMECYKIIKYIMKVEKEYQAYHQR